MSISAPMDTPFYDGILTSLPWWNNNYLFRRAIQIDPLDHKIPALHPAEVFMSKAITLNMGKVRPDFADIVVLYRTPNEGFWQVVPYSVEDAGVDIKIRFQIRAEIEEINNAEYYVYYGNSHLLGGTVVVPEFDDTLWPVDIDLNDGQYISYIRPGEEWIETPDKPEIVSTVMNSVATLTVAAERIRWLSTKRYTAAIAEVNIDGGQWNQINLFSVDEQTNIVAYEITDLDKTVVHRMRIRVSGLRDPRASGDEIIVNGFEVSLSMLVTLLGEETVGFNWNEG